MMYDKSSTSCCCSSQSLSRKSQPNPDSIRKTKRISKDLKQHLSFNSYLKTGPQVWAPSSTWLASPLKKSNILVYIFDYHTNNSACNTHSQWLETLETIYLLQISKTHLGFLEQVFLGHLTYWVQVRTDVLVCCHSVSLWFKGDVC